ncbi:MAG: bifunctional [glutamine synthetase] adenylyltransferase/[glutamine synthetase]-adenylyl-L-tyrosine phosphorylase [Novosphingobium sp.]
MAQQADWSGALARARAYSPFLSGLLDREKDLAALLAQGRGEDALGFAVAAGHGAAEVPVALRRERRALALALGIGDLAGAFPLARVMAELSAFADRAMDAAIRYAMTSRMPDAEPKGMIALALGKHGAGELNYSSDIDPILLYDPALLPRRAHDEPGEAAQRYARDIVQTLSRIDADGYVFRVDLRLRPQSEISPLAIPLEAALTHYESSALAWERAAFIRARACGGDVAAGEAFLAAIRPFIWRRSIDFGTITEIGRLTMQIRAGQDGAQHPGPGFDIKRGRGGIREVEFYAQTHQLIHGGRNPALRLRGTRASLDALAAAGIIPAGDAQMLGQAYDRLRVIEHRLQMVSDQQTHSLPEDPAALDRVARLEGVKNGKALVRELAAITDAVGRKYDALIAVHAGDAAPSAPPPAASGKRLAAELDALGFEMPDELAARIEGWRSGKLKALRSDAAIAAFDAIQPALLAALARAPEPRRAFNRWEDLLSRLPSAISLFHLLEARPALLDLVARILGLAPPLADALAQRADLLDALIDATAFELPGSLADLVDEFATGEADDDYERLLDRVRRKVGEKRFALGVQLLDGMTDPLDQAAAYARIAEAALAVLVRAASAEFERAHGVVPDGDLVVLGLGRLGGGALTPASDLDLVYCFTGSHQSESDGPKPLGATLYFNRLAQRAGAALSVPTAQGALYEVDTRLRPSGSNGPLAVSLESFARYQSEDAWTWKHMALCRARVVYGPAHAREALDAILSAVLTRPRDPVKLRADVLSMRAEMAEHKPCQGPLDAKLMRGGLVDLEFIVHFLQLRDGIGLDPSLPRAIAALADAGMVPPALSHAHDVMTRLLVAARLLAPDRQFPPGGVRAVLARACQCDDWEALLGEFAESRGVVAETWRHVFGAKIEVETV